VVRSRAKLLDAATELLIDGGPRAVTVDAVAERSGVAKSTMYRHFDSQTALLVAVLRHNLPDVALDITDLEFADGVRSTVRAIATALADPRWARILPALLSLQHTIPDVREFADADDQAQLIHLHQLVDKGVAEGLLPAETELATTMSLLAGPLLHAALHNEIDRLPDLADEVADRYLASCVRAGNTIDAERANDALQDPPQSPKRRPTR